MYRDYMESFLKGCRLYTRGLYRDSVGSYQRATRLATRSFDHGSYMPLPVPGSSIPNPQGSKFPNYKVATRNHNYGSKYGNLTWTSKEAKIMAQYPKIESKGSIGSIVLGILEVQVSRYFGRLRKNLSWEVRLGRAPPGRRGSYC